MLLSRMPLRYAPRSISHSRYFGKSGRVPSKGTHYIWRTRGDGKVRSSHAKNNGKIFSWDNPPPTGHPGSDYGCRCVAEPLATKIEEHVDITLTGISDSGYAWGNKEFVNHYFHGNGEGVLVRETGHLQSIANAYRQNVILDRKRLPSQIANMARRTKNGHFSDTFYKPYDLTSVVFSVGNTTIGGSYSGTVAEQYDVLTFSGKIDFYLKDEFADPLGIREFIDLADEDGNHLRRILHESYIDPEIFDPGRAIQENILLPIEDRIWQILNRDIPSPYKQRRPYKLGIHKGKPYSITDEWNGYFRGEIYMDRNASIF